MDFGRTRCWQCLSNIGPIFLLMSVWGIGCDKASGPSTSGAEVGGPTTEPIKVRGPESPESHREPAAQDRESGEARNEPVSAQERPLLVPHFDDSASVEFKKAFVGLDTWVRGKGGRIHAALVDLETDKWLLRSGASEPVNPASNAKLVTAAAALELLGPEYAFSTELFGSIDGKGFAAALVLRGSGAPDFTTPDLYRLMRIAIGQGLVSVDKIVVDQSHFSDQYVPPAFEQQPREWAPFRAPISALALNGNSISLNVVPTRESEPARIWYDPPGVVVESGLVLTSEKGTGDRVSWTLLADRDAAHPTSQVGGRLAFGHGRQRYARRMEDPRLAPGLAFSALLKEAGIKVADDKVVLGTREGEPRIAIWKSEPIAELVRAMGKDSDNFTAEMLFVALSQHRSEEEIASKTEVPRWSSERGAEVARAWLEKKGMKLDGIVIKNGSGLFDANRLSAELITALLASMEDNPRIAQEFISHLAMGATDGDDGEAHARKRARAAHSGQNGNSPKRRRAEWVHSTTGREISSRFQSHRCGTKNESFGSSRSGGQDCSQVGRAT
jgi:D-alanyl-D-alanine carboxypeptidase/D-alanyl-D-alanine-endopeptidase (penicillin-binding protein 4)